MPSLENKKYRRAQIIICVRRNREGVYKGDLVREVMATGHVDMVKYLIKGLIKNDLERLVEEGRIELRGAKYHFNKFK